MTIHRLNLSGERFGRLTAIEPIGPNKNKQIVWRCLCDCGNETFVVAAVLHRGDVRSCGCLRRDTTRVNKTVHGHRYERLYGIWKNMNKRCHMVGSNNYERYGGRGIHVCNEWRDSYEKFRDWSYENGYADNLSIDRINNNDGYSPENCRWADRFTQANNTRRSRQISYNDVTHGISEWSRILGVPKATLRTRINRNDMGDFERYFQE
jgi:hypothetical protein